MSTTSQDERIAMAWEVIERAMTGTNPPTQDELMAAQWVVDRATYSQGCCNPALEVVPIKKKKKKGKKK